LNNKTRDFNIHKFQIFEIMSVPAEIPLRRSSAWRFSLGYDRVSAYSRKEDHRSYMQLGLGRSEFFFSSKLGLYALMGADVGYSAHYNTRWDIGPMLILGTIARLNDTVSLQAKGDFTRTCNSDTCRNRRRAEVGAALYFNPHLSFRLVGNVDEFNREASAWVGHDF